MFEIFSFVKPCELNNASPEPWRGVEIANCFKIEVRVPLAPSAFIQLTGKEERDQNRINLEPGKPIVFGPDDEYGIMINLEGARVVKVADVGIDAIKVHDPADPNPGIAFALSRISHGPYGPTPVGIFRQVERASYGDGVRQQLVDAQARKGPGDLATLLASGGTWTVE